MYNGMDRGNFTKKEIFEHRPEEEATLIPGGRIYSQREEPMQRP